MAAPYNAVFGFPNWTPYAAISGGGWQTAYPAANMLSPEPIARVARTADVMLTSTQMVATFTTWRAVALVVLCRHSISDAGLVRVTAWYDTAMTQLMTDSGWVPAWSQAHAVGEVEWEQPSFWNLHYSPEEISGFPWHVPIMLPSRVSAMAVKVEINDTLNPAGTLDIGYLLISDIWQASINFDQGAGFGFPAALTVAQTAMGGADYFDPRDKPRGFQGNFTYMNLDEVKRKMFELYRMHDIHLPFFWWANPQDSAHMVRDAFPARIDKMQMMTYAAPLLGTFPISMKEAF